MGRPIDEKGEEVGSHVSPATSPWCGDLLQRPSLVWTSISSSSKIKRLEGFISKISSSSVKSFLKSGLERLISKGGRKGQRGAEEGEGGERLPHFLYETLGKRLPLSFSILFLKK